MPSHPLVLLHGLNTTAAVFDGVRSALPSTLAVHTPELPALADVDAIATALLKTLPARFHLVGFSFGGYVALAMRALAPERLSGLGLVCSGPQADTAAQAAARRQAIGTAANGGHAQLVAAQTAAAFHPDSLGDALLMQRRTAMVAAYGAERFMAHQEASLARPERGALLDGRVPTLIVAGSHDKLFAPEHQRALAQGIPGAEFHAVPGAGHLLPLEQPEALAAHLARWVATTSSL
jgi:pimeloyl-ACP methyl ester carboxylesterase